jgi:dihydropteroate synthase/2-amino-4-hydroxy-6-hydroxymethyldihydropteridine diphosphokinase
MKQQSSTTTTGSPILLVVEKAVLLRILVFLSMTLLVLTASPRVLTSRQLARKFTSTTLLVRGGQTASDKVEVKKNPRAQTPFVDSPWSNSSLIDDQTTAFLTQEKRTTATTTSTLAAAPAPLARRNVKARKYRVYLAVGSNLGNCFQNIQSGMAKLCDPHVHPKIFLPTDFVRSSFLYRTAPMYVTDQPSFWNGAVEIATDMDPHTLLRRLKLIEHDMGRQFAALRNGPRPLDLDILLYYENNNNNPQSTDNDNASTATSTPVLVNTEDLMVPHPRISEREFVLAPLADVAGRNLLHPNHQNTSIGDLLDDIVNVASDNDGDNVEAAAGRILPLPRGRSLFFNETIIMGILNVTPDSFSDGGKWTTTNRAVDRAMEMIAQGATIIDIGGESTRPGAAEISVEEQISRTIPVILGIRQRAESLSKDVVLSIDTRHAAVARAAVEAGVDIVNDVSGGTFDKDMLTTVAELQVSIILMHMRGTPKTMSNLTKYQDEGGVVDSVVRALMERSQAAEEAGIQRWMQVLDLGIGFAKDFDGNLSLLKHYGEIRSQLGNVPLLLGTSRKGFIGKITGEDVAEERDFGTVGSCIAALCLGKGDPNSGGGEGLLGCNILRVHNVKACKQAASMMDAIIRAK